MAAPNSGLAAQFAFEQESTPGTYETPTHFLEFLNESITDQTQWNRSNGLRAGRRVAHAFTKGTTSYNGQTSHELTAETVAALLELCVGGLATTGASDPYTHTITPDTLDTATLQIGTPGTGGTVHPRSYTGAMVRSWELSVDPGTGFVILNVDWECQAETTAEDLETASYATFTRLTFRHATLELASSEVCVDNITIRGDNNLDVTHKVCSTAPGAPTIRESGMRTYSGSATADFADLTQYNRFKNGTEVAFSLELAASANDSVTITGNVHFLPDATPTVTGAEVVKNPINFEFVHGTSDSSGFTVVVKNGDSSA